jgi:Alpha/beta hydrolase domain
LAGREIVLSPEDFMSRYRTVQAYLTDFSANLDATINAGFLLDLDRAAILDSATVKAHAAYSSIEQGQLASQ